MVNFKSILLCFSILCLFNLAEIQAQKSPECVKVAKTNRPTLILISSGELDKFYKNFSSVVKFGGMKMVKSELAYYLLAKEENGPRVFAFELEEKGKKLFLNKYLPVQTCDQGNLALDTFLQDDERIMGCKLGAHTIKQLEKKRN